MSRSKTAIIVLSDPKAGSEESLGRLYNALAAAYDFKQRGDDVTILFQGAGTRWLGELAKREHPAFELFEAVKDRVAGASMGCATAFGAKDDVARQGFDLIAENFVPDGSGLPSLSALSSQGRQLLIF